jgi:nicotinate-nucleotide adenylyltransferase
MEGEDSVELTGCHTALFGGSFDPPHFGHLSLAYAVIEQTLVNEVIFIPAGQSPLKDQAAVASAEERLAMLEAAVSEESRFSVLDWEVVRTGLSYSIDTVIRFQDEHPEKVLYWLLGEDQVEQLHLWYRIDELFKRVRFIAYRRNRSHSAREVVVDENRNNFFSGGITWLEGEPLPYSSSAIREAFVCGEKPQGLPSSVADYIESKLIYTKR